MTTLAYPARDSLTMLRRNVRHMLRYPSLTLMLLGQPIVFLLLFVYVFGGTLGAGLGPDGGRGEYLAFVTPGILVITVASVSLGTAISVAMDATEGIMARFRTMAISRASVLTGHVLGTLIQAVLGLAVILAVAMAAGFRPSAGGGGWLAAAGLLVLFTVALTWLSLALGLVSKSVETASNLPMVLTLLPFLGSGFVPTDSMPAWLRVFADYQPFTPVIDTLRSLLLGTPVDGGGAALAVGWSVVIALVGYVWAKWLFPRRAGR
ncbi:ABC transporter permease [Prauserella cavernicola]|uniref:Transport permease protein n=1 Tax=Prauserella cavernicola TaxID=2800127 RepID=A0A934V2R1_9PSEU|nr:ABC transporter permease [Prauserella cavernicola]MBK1783402.1 ABC transporter permease [Prauserella cavernicola]